MAALNRWQWLHVQASPLTALCNLSVAQHFSPISHRSKCWAESTVYCLYLLSQFTHHFASYNDKPVSSPHNVNKLHFFPCLDSRAPLLSSAPLPPSRDDGCVLKNFIYNISSSLRTTSDPLSAAFRWHSEQEESCYLAIVCQQSEQEVCACMCVHTVR